MSKKANKIIYYIATGILTILVLMYIGNSIFNNTVFSKRFAEMGYPTYLIYPITIAKALGLLAIWTNKSNILKEWAYAGFFFVFILAFLAETHFVGGDYFTSPLALISLLTSYIFRKKLVGEKTTNS